MESDIEYIDSGHKAATSKSKRESQVQKIVDVNSDIIIVHESAKEDCFTINNCVNSTIIILKSSTVVKLVNVTTCRIYLGVCRDMVGIIGCQNCSISAICQTLLVKASHDNLLYISSTKIPYVQDSKNNLFAAFNGRCELLIEQLAECQGSLNPNTMVHTKGYFIANVEKKSTDFQHTAIGSINNDNYEVDQNGTVKLLPQIRQTSLVLKGKLSQFGVEKVHELFSCLDVNLKLRLKRPAIERVNSAMLPKMKHFEMAPLNNSHQIENSTGTSKEIGFLQFCNHFQMVVSEGTSSDMLNKVFLQLGVDAESMPAWVIHIPHFQTSLLSNESLQQPNYLLAMATPKHKSETIGDSKKIFGHAVTSKTSVQLAATPANPMLLQAHLVRSRTIRTLADIENALVLIFKVTSRFYRFRKTLFKEVSNINGRKTVSASMLFSCLRDLVNMTSPLYRRYGKQVLFTKIECQSILERIVELQRQQLGNATGETANENEDENVNLGFHAIFDTVILYMHIFRPVHLRDKAIQSYSEWQHEVKGNTGRYNTCYQLGKALAGKQHGPQISPSKTQHVEAVLKKYQVLPEWAIKSEAIIKVHEWLNSVEGKCSMQHMIQEELTKVHVQDQNGEEGEAYLHQCKDSIRSNIRKARIQQEMKTIMTESTRAAELVQLYLKAVRKEKNRRKLQNSWQEKNQQKLQSSHTIEVMSFEDWLRDRQKNWKTAQACNMAWEKRDNARKQLSEVCKHMHT